MDSVRQSPVLPFKDSFYVGIRLLLMKFKLIRGNQKPPIRLQIDFLVICHFPVWSRRFQGELVRTQPPGPAWGHTGPASDPRHRRSSDRAPLPTRPVSEKWAHLERTPFSSESSRGSFSCDHGFDSHPCPEASCSMLPTPRPPAPSHTEPQAARAELTIWCLEETWPAPAQPRGLSASACVFTDLFCLLGSGGDLPHTPTTPRGHLGPPASWGSPHTPGWT